jgi:RNA polymerase sigma-70 factor (ECF subfamily)
VVAERRRGSARRQRLLDRFGPDLVRSVLAEPEPPLDLDRLTRCLQGLSERERSVVVLSFYADRPSAEIATEVGLTPANVRVVRHRALGRLRQCLEARA